MADILEKSELERIRELIYGKRWQELKYHVMDLKPPDISELMEFLSRAEGIALFRFLPNEISTEVFSYLDSPEKDSLLAALTDDETRLLLAEMSPDDRTSFLENLPGQAIQRMMNLLQIADRKEAMRLLGYPEESVGRLMTPDYVAVRSCWTVEKALEHIRRRGLQSETVNMVFVTDQNWKLLDELELKRFILSEPGDTVQSIMDNTFVSVEAELDREVAVQTMQKYDINVLPVTDLRGVLLGIITVDDVMDVAEEEATEDMHLAAAVEPLKGSYSDTGVWTLFKKRIVWLIGLVFLNLAASGVIAAYEHILSSAIALAFFIPLLNAGSGNVGSQCATLIIRAQATGDIKPGEGLGVIFKEVRVGLLLGVGMGLLTYMCGYMFSGPEVALVLSGAMMLTVIIINVVGVTLPMFLNKIGLDPAMASSPLITSVADAVGLIIYFFLATRLISSI